MLQPAGGHIKSTYIILVSECTDLHCVMEVSPTFNKTQNHTKAYHQAPLAKVHQSGNLTHFSEAVHQKGMLDLLLYWFQFS